MVSRVPPSPAVAALRATLSPAAEHDDFWGLERDLPVTVCAYVGPIDIPDDEVTSVRCLVRVDDRIVVCTNANGRRHPWPGGRLEPGEGIVEAACREVEEETGWLLDAPSLRAIGWLHVQPGISDHPWERNEIVMVVWTGNATDRVGGRDNDWTDTEGFELSSALLTLDDAITVVAPDDPTAIPFLRLLA